MSRSETLPCGPNTPPSRTCTEFTSVCSIAAPIAATRFASSLQARAVAPPAQTMPREPQAPLE